MLAQMSLREPLWRAESGAIAPTVITPATSCQIMPEARLALTFKPAMNPTIYLVL
jgi:hypothetical protein